MRNQYAQEELRLREPLLDADERDSDAAADVKSDARSAKRAAKPMAAVEQLMLSPYEKWLTHGRFPYKIVLHVLLLVLTCAQMGIYGAQNASYMRATHRNWYVAYTDGRTSFFHLQQKSASCAHLMRYLYYAEPRYQRELFTVNETLEALAFMRDAYFSIGNTSVANYEYLLTPSGQITPMRMRVTRRLPHGTLNATTYDVVEDPRAAIGPFDPTMSLWQQRYLLRSLYAIKFSFRLKDLQYGDYYEECFQWHVHVSFTMIESAQLKAEIDECHVARCTSRSFWSALKQRFVWLHIVIALVALVYMVLSMKALVRSYRMITRARELLQEHVQNERGNGAMDLGTQQEAASDEQTLRQQRFNQLQSDTFGAWTKIPFALKLKLFNGLYAIGRVHVAGAAALELAVEPVFPEGVRADPLLAPPAARDRAAAALERSRRWGAPRVLQFLVGVSPIYIGYALFGTIYFGARIKEFGTLSASMATLFAVMNGDVILDTFDAFDVHHFSVSGKLYLYSFISLFIYVVLNIFIAIVEEAFFATRSCRRTLSILLTDPAFETAKVAQETEISAEMVRALLRFADSEDENK